jgi:hypothetical protein
MPQKIRELKQILRQAGFTEIAGKGSHTNWTISGQNSDDAKRYQEKDVSKAIEEIQQNRDLEDDEI